MTGKANKVSSSLDLTGIWKHCCTTHEFVIFGTMVFFHNPPDIRIAGFFSSHSYLAEHLSPSLPPWTQEQHADLLANPVTVHGEGIFVGNGLELSWRSNHPVVTNGTSSLSVVSDDPISLQGIWQGPGTLAGQDYYLRVNDLSAFGEQLSDLQHQDAHVVHNRREQLRASVRRLLSTHRYEHNVFVMMRYRPMDHKFAEIRAAIRDACKAQGFSAHLANDHAYESELWANVSVYMHSCKFGIIVYEQLETRDFNPNISIELGYMYASGKRCLILRDRTIPALPANIAGFLYSEFDPYNIRTSVYDRTVEWLEQLKIDAHV